MFSNKEPRHNLDNGDWRPVLLNSNNRSIPTFVTDNAITESSFRSTAGYSQPIEAFTTTSTTRRPLSSYTRATRPGPRAFEIVSDSTSTSLPISHYSSNSLSSNGNLYSSVAPIVSSSFVPMLSSPSPTTLSTALSTQSTPSTNSNVRLASTGSVSDINIEPSCFDCICEATSGCDEKVKCRTNQFGEFVCGPFAMNRFFWTEAGKPGNQLSENSFETCALNRTCAEQTISSYVNKNQIDCNDDGTIDCLDIAALTRLGKAACNLHSLLDSVYWSKFQQCYGFGDE